MKARARSIMLHMWRYGPADLSPAVVGRQAAIHLAHYPCGLYGNPRRWWAEGPKHAEQRQPRLYASKRTCLVEDGATAFDARPC
jgi:hypothetical protein